MAKTIAEKQKAYRERQKACFGEEFLKKERKRVKKARVPAALLTQKELASRRKKQNEWKRRGRMLKKMQKAAESEESGQDDQSTSGVQKASPFIV